MGVCQRCNGEMLKVKTCLGSIVTLGGRTYDRIRLGQESFRAKDDHSDVEVRCECGVEPGGLHHQYCDGEECPRCGGQVIACDCLSSIPSNPARCSPRAKQARCSVRYSGSTARIPTGVSA